MGYIMSKNKNIVSIALHPLLYKTLKHYSNEHNVAFNKFVNWGIAYWLANTLAQPVPFPLQIYRNSTMHAMVKKYFLSK
jgi:hypothetical protein